MEVKNNIPNVALQPRPYPKLLSLVIPCYNEQAVIPLLRAQLDMFLQKLLCPVEVILVNDGSRDQTLYLLYEWSKQDERIKVIGLSRNFGHQIAVTAGMDAARGDAVVIIDADLQDPLEVIFEMFEKYQLGYDVVYGQRMQRDGETWFKRVTAWVFYRLMRKLIHKDLPVDAGDFRLLSRRAVDAVNSLRESHRFLRGMAAWVGFTHCPVYYHRKARAAGESKYPLRKMLAFSWTAAVSFSTLPLRMLTVIGTLATLLGFACGIYAIVNVVAHRLGYAFAAGYSAGWASLVTLNWVLGGTVLVSLGVIGEYVGRIYEEIKGRPLYLVSSRFNMDNSKGDHT